MIRLPTLSTALLVSYAINLKFSLLSIHVTGKVHMDDTRGSPRIPGTSHSISDIFVEIGTTGGAYRYGNVRVLIRQSAIGNAIALEWTTCTIGKPYLQYSIFSFDNKYRYHTGNLKMPWSRRFILSIIAEFTLNTLNLLFGTSSGQIFQIDVSHAPRDEVTGFQSFSNATPRTKVTAQNTTTGLCQTWDPAPFEASHHRSFIRGTTCSNCTPACSCLSAGHCLSRKNCLSATRFPLDVCVAPKAASSNTIQLFHALEGFPFGQDLFDHGFATYDSPWLGEIHKVRPSSRCSGAALKALVGDPNALRRRTFAEICKFIFICSKVAIRLRTRQIQKGLSVLQECIVNVHSPARHGLQCPSEAALYGPLHV